MNIQVRKALIKRARRRTEQLITYQQLSDECSLGLNMAEQFDRNAIAEILDEISTFEHEHGRPLLSSLVVRANDGHEGKGFYKLAERLGFGDRRLLEEGFFATNQINECIAFWQNDTNFSTHQ